MKKKLIMGIAITALILGLGAVPSAANDADVVLKLSLIHISEPTRPY